jgi:putative membrane protein
MQTEAQRILAEWTLPPGLTAVDLTVAAVYVRGWRALRRTRAAYFTGSRLAWFLLGMAILWLAIASPLDGFADRLLSAHMVQHFLLMSVVPPLVLLGAPVAPLLRGLPRWMIVHPVGFLLRLGWLRRLTHAVTGPAFAWISFNGLFLAWHLPAAYDLALNHEWIHDTEHLCFLLTALLFWNIVLHPWPGRQRVNGWIALLFLLSADVVNTALSAFLAFCGRPIYPFYIHLPNQFGIAPLADQVAAGVLMWVLNSTVFLVPAMLLAMHLSGASSGGFSSGASAVPLFPGSSNSPTATPVSR